VFRHRFLVLFLTSGLTCLALAAPARPQTTATAPAAGAQDPDKPDPSGDQLSGEPLTLQEEIVVTANRIPASSEAVGSSVTVIGREEIERRNEPSVLNLLRTVPGLEVAQGGGPGSVASVFVRGANSNHTLVLVDGVRVSDSSGGFDFSILRTDDLDRIEVLRGPQSTLYGSEAIGGVISLTTRRGRDGFHYDVDGRAGSLGTHEVRVSADGGRSGFDYSFSLADRHTDGVSVASERRGNTERDPFSDVTAAARLSFSVPADGRVNLVLRHTDAKSDLDGFTFGIGPTDDPNYVQKRSLLVTSLQYDTPVTRWWNLHLAVGASDDKNKGRDPDTFFNNYDLRSRHRELSAQSDFKLDGNNTLVAGLSSEHRQGDNQGAYDESLNLSSLYLQDNFSWHDHLFLTAGARHDRYSSFDSKTTYRVTASYLWPGTSWRLHGSLGTGFRGPSFDELFFPQAGNPRLRPETSQGWDLGLNRSFFGGVLTAGVTYFANRFDDLIDFDSSTFTFANIRRADSKGIEATLQLQPRADTELQASYTYDETKDLATGQPLARRPRHRLTLLAAFQPTERLRGVASLVAVEHRIDSDGTQMDSYHRVDLTMEYRLKPWLQPFVLVQNVLGEGYEEISGYTSPGRTALLGIRFLSR